MAEPIHLLLGPHHSELHGMLADADHSQLPDSWTVERRPDGAVLVRVPPRSQTAPPLPDAVFTFRAGDPQFDFWADQVAQQES